MSYSVKEIFYTLQGEGAQAGRAAVFCRFSGCNLWSGRESEDVRQFAGEFTARVTPVPIPNTEVKPRWADGTARVTVWEIRLSPA